MARGEDGVWRATGDASWRDAEYAFEVTVFAPGVDAVVTNVVTDPVFGGAHAGLDPVGAGEAAAARRVAEAAEPRAAGRDLRAARARLLDLATRRCPAEQRGTYLAFTHLESDGMRHLRALAEAGMTHVHLLPCHDIATLNADRSAHARPRGARPPAAGLARAAAPDREGSATATASTGATTRCTTRRPRAPTRSTTAPPSSARWSRRSTRSACASCSTSSTTTRPPPARTRARSWTGSSPATTTGSRRTGGSRARPAARTPRASTG